MLISLFSEGLDDHRDGRRERGRRGAWGGGTRVRSAGVVAVDTHGSALQHQTVPPHTQLSHVLQLSSREVLVRRGVPVLGRRRLGIVRDVIIERVREVDVGGGGEMGRLPYVAEIWQGLELHLLLLLG